MCHLLMMPFALRRSCGSVATGGPADSDAMALDIEVLLAAQALRVGAYPLSQQRIRNICRNSLLRCIGWTSDRTFSSSHKITPSTICEDHAAYLTLRRKLSVCAVKKGSIGAHLNPGKAEAEEQ